MWEIINKIIDYVLVVVLLLLLGVTYNLYESVGYYKIKIKIEIEEVKYVEEEN
jgi:hypothetical protein